jgi:hypothetical protein
MGIKNHTLGETRYLTYQLIFPGDKDVWTDQEPFWGPLDTWLRLTTFARRPDVCAELLIKGEARWKDTNGVTHKLSIDTQERPRVWGTKKGKRT